MLVLLVFSSPCLKKKTEWLTRASIDALPLYSLCAEQYCNVLKRNRRVFPERIDYIFLFCVSSSQKLHFPSSFSFSRVIASVKAEFYLTDLLSDTVISLFPKKIFPILYLSIAHRLFCTSFNARSIPLMNISLSFFGKCWILQDRMRRLMRLFLLAKKNVKTIERNNNNNRRDRAAYWRKWMRCWKCVSAPTGQHLFLLAVQSFSPFWNRVTKERLKREGILGQRGSIYLWR